MPKKAVQSGSALMASNWDDSSSDEGGSSMLNAGRWTTDQKTMHARRIPPKREKPQQRNVRLTAAALREHMAATGGSQTRSGPKSAASAASAATAFGITSLKDVLDEVARTHGDELRACKSAEEFMVNITMRLVLKLMPSVWRQLENIQGIMRRGNFTEALKSFKLSTQRSKTVNFTNRTAIRQIGGTPLWKLLCKFLGNKLEGPDAFWAYTFTLVFSLNCQLHRAVEMLEGKVDLKTDPFILRVGNGIKSAMKSSTKLTVPDLVKLFVGETAGGASVNAQALLAEVAKQAAAAAQEVDDKMEADNAPQLMKLDIITLFVSKLRKKVFANSFHDIKANPMVIIDGLRTQNSGVVSTLSSLVGAGNVQPLQEFMQRQSNADAQKQMLRFYLSALRQNEALLAQMFCQEQSNLDGRNVVHSSRVEELDE